MVFTCLVVNLPLAFWKEPLKSKILYSVIRCQLWSLVFQNDQIFHDISMSICFSANVLLKSIPWDLRSENLRIEDFPSKWWVGCRQVRKSHRNGGFAWMFGFTIWYNYSFIETYQQWWCFFGSASHICTVPGTVSKFSRNPVAPFYV